jgi:hypothetical protein
MVDSSGSYRIHDAPANVSAQLTCVIGMAVGIAVDAGNPHLR